MNSMDRKLRVFLCHASQDKSTVREFYQQLLAEGWIEPWLDEEKLLPGHNWDMEIEMAVKSADAVMVFLSNNSVTKEGYIQKELRSVLDVAEYKPEGAIFIIPIRLESCQLPRRLKDYQYQDYFTDTLQAYNRLISSLENRAEVVKVDIIQIKENIRRREQERAKREREEQIRKEAEERIRREEEDLIRQKAEEKARKSLERKLRKEANEKARREKEEQELREIEERTRIEKEEQEKGRLEEERTRKEKEEREQREAEERAKYETKAKEVASQSVGTEYYSLRDSNLRNDLKSFLSSYDPESLVSCSGCGNKVKIKSLIAHIDNNHGYWEIQTYLDAIRKSATPKKLNRPRQKRDSNSKSPRLKSSTQSSSIYVVFRISGKVDDYISSKIEGLLKGLSVNYYIVQENFLSSFFSSHARNTVSYSNSKCLNVAGLIQNRLYSQRYRERLAIESFIPYDAELREYGKNLIIIQLDASLFKR